MTEVIFQHVCPNVILLDKGSNLNADVITALIEHLGIHQDFTSPYNPLTNGTVERANVYCVNVLKRFQMLTTITGIYIFPPLSLITV